MAIGKGKRPPDPNQLAKGIPTPSKREFELANHDRGYDRIDGWVGPSSIPKSTCEPLVEAIVKKFRTRITTRFCLPCLRGFPPGLRREADEVKTVLLKNEAPLNCVSLRSLIHYGDGSGGQGSR
jgi:hypothetical protein